MRHERNPNGEPLDDAELGRLVKGVASDWVMPPIRLDEPGWRDRIRPSSPRPPFSLSPWLRRFAGAVGVATVLTIVVAMLGVWLALPRSAQVGKPGTTPAPSVATPSNTSSATPPAASPSPSSTSLPALYLEGTLPSPSRLVVELEDGNFAMADLATGKLGGPFGGGRPGSGVRRAPDGSLYCLCISYSGLGDAGTGATVYFNRYSVDGLQLASAKLDEVAGQPDPRDPLNVPPDPEHVRAVASFGGDPRFAFVGWSARAHPAWHSGLIVVDATTGQQAGRIDFPDTTDGEADSRRFTDAPVVVGTDGDKLLIARQYYTFQRANSRSSDPVFNTDAYTYELSLPMSADAKLTPIEAVGGCGDYIEAGGFTAAGGTWVACPNGLGGVTVRRISADGTATDIHINGTTGIDGTTLARSSDGKYVYAWDPVGLILTRVDVTTGETDSATGPKPAAVFDPLRAIGRWLVPSAQAKMLLQAGIVVSGDGKHVYALGVDRSGDSEFGTSAGVFDFDVEGAPITATRWDPASDYVSVAVSNDGRFVYAAGAPTADPTTQPADPYASITVYDAATGKIRLIARELGFVMVTFAQTSLPQP